MEGNFLTAVDTGTMHAKIQSRLLSSKILSAQITTILDSLKVLLNPALKQPREMASESSKITSIFDRSAPMSERPTKVRKKSASVDNEISEKHTPFVNVDSEKQTDSGRESGSVDEEGQPERDDGWESGSIVGSGFEGGDSEDESDSDNDELTVTTTKHPQKPAPKATKGSSSTLQSTFLPSLSVGFVRGSDDSEFSDAEGKTADLPKKNRRGQRARRA